MIAPWPVPIGPKGVRGLEGTHRWNAVGKLLPREARPIQTVGNRWGTPLERALECNGSQD
jgi:hypothetical protein